MSVPEEIREKHPYHRPAFIVKGPERDVPREQATYSSREEWRQDAAGYFIIKVFYKEGYLGARHFTNQHEPTLDVVGTDAEEIVQTIVRKGLVSTLQHAAYLGHELKKAEVALALGIEFVQDSPLDYEKKTSKDESDNLPE